MTKRRKVMIGAAVAAVVALGVGGVIVANVLDDDDIDLAGADLDRATAAARDAVGGGTVIGAERGDGGLTYELEMILPDGREADVYLDPDFEVIHSDVDGGPVGARDGGARDGGSGGGQTDRDHGSDDLTGTTLERASAAALAEVAGVVTDAELADSGSGYEVTVRSVDGLEFDMILDDDFTVISSVQDLDD